MTAEYLTLTEPVAGYPVLEISHPAARARVALHGAHLMEWTPAGEAPVLYLSPDAVLRPGKALRGGIPICWPWFGPHATDSSLPAHGFARTSLWELSQSRSSPQGIDLEFTLPSAPTALWPIRPVLHMHIGHTLRISLTTTHTGGPAPVEPVAITSALHTYLAVADIHQVSVHGLHGATYQDHMDNLAVHEQSGDIRITGEVDRDYLTSTPVTLHDPAAGRTITLRSTGSGCTIVWNPWIEKSRTMADLPDTDYTRFLCLETANAWRDRILLHPGQSHTLTAEISVAASRTAEATGMQ